MIRKPPILAILFAAVCCTPAPGQTPAATLYVELQNVVEYQVDTPDLSKYGTDPNVTPGKIAKGLGVGCAGVQLIGYGDIVSVNGQPARGTYANRGVAVCVTPTPVPGVNGSNAISDTTWPSMRDETYEILQSDGITPVGTIMTYDCLAECHRPQDRRPEPEIPRLPAARAHSSAFEGKEARVR